MSAGRYLRGEVCVVHVNGEITEKALKLAKKMGATAIADWRMWRDSVTKADRKRLKRVKSLKRQRKLRAKQAAER